MTDYQIFNIQINHYQTKEIKHLTLSLSNYRKDSNASAKIRQRIKPHNQLT
jgi:hypothetical protein